jgi:hypothetical protein
MSIDKRINFRGGGMDMGNTKSQARSASMGNTTSRSTSSGTGGSKGNLGGGGGGQGSEYRQYKAPTKPTYTQFNIDNKPVTGADYERGRNQFIDNLNKNNAARFQPSFFNRTYKPVTLDTVGARNQKTGLNQGLATLLSFATGIPFNLLYQGKEVFSNLNNKITNIRDKINNFQGDYRQKFTGYRTQQDYDNARQNRINLKSIDRIQNTLDRKYPDGDYSNTDLDERLADLKQSMGIVSNTPEQNEQQYLNFGNPNMANLNDVQSIFSAPTQGITGIKFPEQTSKAELEAALGAGFVPERDNPFEQVVPQQKENGIMGIYGIDVGYPSNDLMAFAPNSKRDRALKNLYSGYENLNIKDPQMIDLMQQDLQENQEKGTPLSLPQNAYSLIG